MLTEARKTLKELPSSGSRQDICSNTFTPRQTQFAVFFLPLFFSYFPRERSAFPPYFNARLISYRSCRRFSCLERLRSIPRRHNEPNRPGKHTRIAHTHRSYTMYNENVDRSRDRNINSSLLN